MAAAYGSRIKSEVFAIATGTAPAAKPWIKAFFNSFFVNAASTLLMMFFGMLIAYALAKVNFKGCKKIDSLLTLQMFSLIWFF